MQMQSLYYEWEVKNRQREDGNFADSTDWMNRLVADAAQASMPAPHTETQPAPAKKPPTPPLKRAG